MATPTATNQAGPVCPRLSMPPSPSIGRRSGTAGARRHSLELQRQGKPGNRNISLHFSVRFSSGPTGKPAPFTSPAFPSPSPVASSSSSLPRTAERGTSSGSIPIRPPDDHGDEADAEVCGLVRRRRPAGRRVRARRAGRVRPHLPLRLHRRLRRHGRRICRDARRGHADGDAGGGGARERAGGGGAGHGGVPRLRRPPQPVRVGGHDGAGPPLQAPDRAVRHRAAAGILPRLHPPPLPHRRHGDPGARPGRGHPADAGRGDGGDPHLLPPLRHLRHDPGPEEPGPHHRPTADGAHRRCQQPRRRQLHRRVHEPGPVLWAGPGHRGLDPPLGLLGRPPAGWAPRRGRLRISVRGQQNARAAAQRRLLTIRHSGHCL